ncbi:helix-turn-helix domain-containing protein [Mongoliitalea daihaiensis]|uniref:helix-turn-helix domain-containing protein n=1 Tax=Mongoliitalea daihaiensis TaxID=2782006 RepID=UPI001F47A3D6|nr:helix-turn-helix transcriptional regulator [Mongoliitalea daihaiensis]UJP63961.1 helix-turn-helix transcriptional regulator [Mongoliitalea daihaiensis]
MVAIKKTEGERLSEFRKQKGLSQVEMAEKLQCSQPNLNKIEKSVVGVSATIRKRLFDAFPDLNPTWFSNGYGQMSFDPKDIPSLKTKDTDSSIVLSAENFINQLSRSRELFMEGKIPQQSMMILFEDIKKIMQLQKERIDELQKDKEFLKSLITSSRENPFEVK